MPKQKKFGKVVYEYQGFKVVPIMKMDKPSGKYGIIAGKYLVSDVMKQQEAIDLLKSGDFKPKKKDKKFSS
jgi:hypothetical protein